MSDELASLPQFEELPFPLEDLHLWAGDREITGEFEVMEGASSFEVRGSAASFDRLTTWSPTLDWRRISAEVKQDVRDSAVASGARGEDFLLLIPKVYMRLRTDAEPS